MSNKPVPLKPQDFLAKDVLARFEFGQLLGQGSFGTVYQVQNRETKQSFAMKIMSYQQLGPRGIEQVKGEIEAMQMLPPHPRLLQLHDVFYSPQGVSMLLDLVRGGELFVHLLRMKHYSERTTALIIRNLLQAISHMHGHGIVHRDLKPDNMLLLQPTSDEDKELSSIVVSDFGFAVPYRGATLTQPCGTPYYLAPEILDVGLYKTRAGYDQMADIWSIGVIAYVLLVGFPPFNGTDKNKLFKAIDSAKPDFTHKSWAGISPVAVDFIKLLLRRQSSERPGAAEALQHPWIQLVSNVPDLHLSSSQSELAKFAKQKLKGAFFGVEAALHLHYLANCTKFQTKPSTAIFDMLALASQPVTTVDLHNTYLGPKGTDALLAALVQNSHVRTLNMTNTLIDDDTVTKLLDLVSLPTSGIRELILDENPITHSVGRRILAMLQKGAGPLKKVSVHRTHISDAIQRKIHETSEGGAAAAAVGAASPVSKAAASPAHK